MNWSKTTHKLKRALVDQGSLTTTPFFPLHSKISAYLKGRSHQRIIVKNNEINVLKQKYIVKMIF